MADQIKELSNGTYFIGALTNGVAIASTNATTQNVVKDIAVQNNQLTALGAALNFNVNNVTVASLSSSVTGSEIIDVSSTAVAVATASFTNDIVGFFGPASGTGGKTTTLSARKVNGVQTSAVTTQSAAVSTTLTITSTLAGAWFVGSDFFYLYDDLNSTQTLYRRVGGINGTENVVFSNSYATIVFNGVDKFHQVNGANIFTYVPATNVTTSVSIKAGAAWSTTMSSYPRIAYANGLVFWYNNAGTSVWAINPTTGYNAQISSAMNTTSSSTYTPLAVYFSAGNYYFLSVNNSYSSGYIYIRSAADFGALISASVYPVTSSAVYTSPIPLITSNNQLNSPWPFLNSSNGDWHWLKTNSGNTYTFGVFNMLTQTIKTDLVITASSPAISGTGQIVLSAVSSADDSANKLNTTFYPQTATLRVTGVQTTP
jgi:hypothetical protein